MNLPILSRALLYPSYIYIYHQSLFFIHCVGIGLSPMSVRLKTFQVNLYIVKIKRCSTDNHTNQR